MPSQPFDQFMKTRASAAEAYVRGDPGPLGQVVAHDGPATFFGPRGGTRQGAAEIASTYAHDARSFQPDGESRLEILQSGESGDLAFWTGVQHAKARMAGQDAPAQMDLRITEVFRRENGEWKLVHRHADMLAQEQPPKPN